MKYIIFSDIHGNLEAYKAVLDNIKPRRGTKFLCVGDIVGYGADPSECIKLTKRLDSVIVCGNHDWASVGRMPLTYFNDHARAAVEWTASVLTMDEKDYLSSLSLTRESDGAILVHGTLSDPERFDYLADRDTAYDMMLSMKTAMAFVGHTHAPAIFTLRDDRLSYSLSPRVEISGEKKYAVNVGSVGQPRDGDWRASYCVWDKSAGTIEIKRVEYDVAEAQRKIIEAGLPEFLAERLSSGR